MSQISTDISTFGSIVSNFFDGKANLSQTGSALENLGKTIGGQISGDVKKVETFLGPQATQAINTGFQDIQQAAGGAITLLDDDVAPYLAAGAKAVEGAVDTIMDAAIPGGTTLNPLVNGGIDAVANGLKAAIDAQAAAWKAKLAASAPAVTTTATQAAA